MKYFLLSILFLPLTVLSQESIQTISNAMNQFGMDASFELSKEEPDYLISPVSISSALGMAYLGALGDTKKEMRKVLYYPEEPILLEGFSQYFDTFNHLKTDDTVSIANKLWVGENRMTLSPEFQSKNLNYFNSDVKVLDFDDATGSSETVNDWVSNQTNGKIPELIGSDFITGDMVMILTNAVYFKSNWAKDFDTELTHKGMFTNELDKLIEVDYMVNKGKYLNYEDDEIHMLQIPYKGNEFSFLIFLPKNSMKDLEGTLLVDNYEYWMNNRRSSKYDLVKVPKFKSMADLKLRELLIQLGMPKAFTGGSFNGMGSASGTIVLSEVIHKTFIDFNEKGTEAAAATAVGAVARSMSVPKQFIVDRPFVYMIIHEKTKSILFMGKMSNPTYLE